MPLAFDPEFRAELYRAEAEVRGLAGQLQSVAEAREEDGLDLTEAVLDAGESLGLGRDLEDVFDDALEPLGSLEIETISISDARSEMPLLKRDGAAAQLALCLGPFAETAALAARLVELLVDAPDRTAVTLAVGLGGSGGCAQGCELPEDVPPSPLFDRR